MSNLSVTISQKSESILVGVVFLLATVICGAVTCFDGELIGGVVAICCALVSGYFFVRAGNQQTLHVDGISVKSYFGEQFYPWNMVEKTRILRTSSKDLPHIEFYIRGRKRTIFIYYTKRTLECLLRYYGEPDIDLVKKPPDHY